MQLSHRLFAPLTSAAARIFAGATSVERRTSRVLAGSVAILSLMVCSVGMANPSNGQVDTFSGNSTDNWQFGHGSPSIVSTGGPGGAGSPYMEMSATGTGGADSKMTLFNDSQWTGNYTAAGVGEITMQLMDLSTSPLTMRVVLKTGTGMTPGWCSTTGFSVPNDGQWHLATFLLDSADLTAVNSPPALSSLLTNVGDLRLIESASPAVDGDTINASVGVADITAVPEPASCAVTLVSCGLLLAGRRRSPY